MTTNKTNHVTKENIEVAKWNIYKMCDTVCTDWQQKLDIAMELFTYESEELETVIFSWLWKKNEENIQTAIKFNLKIS